MRVQCRLIQLPYIRPLIHLQAPRGTGNVDAVGGVWIFKRPSRASNFTQYAGPIFGTSYVGLPCQGMSLAMSFSGDVLAIGGPYNDAPSTNVGAVWIMRCGHARGRNEWE